MTSLLLTAAFLCCVLHVYSSHPACPSGWELHDNFSYLFSDTKATWSEAKNECQKYGGFLAEPYNKKLDCYISGKSITNNVHYWIGLSDQETEGTFVWEHIGRVISDSNWLPGDPNDANEGEDCVLTNWYGQWADAPCDWEEYYVCQIGAECKLDDLGVKYRGQDSSTKDGIECMVWSSLTPNGAIKASLEKLVRMDGPEIVETNYCRNSDNYPEGPYCYTMDSSSGWEYCDIPLCSS